VAVSQERGGQGFVRIRLVEWAKGGSGKVWASLLNLEAGRMDAGGAGGDTGMVLKDERTSHHWGLPFGGTRG